MKRNDRDTTGRHTPNFEGYQTPRKAAPIRRGEGVDVVKWFKRIILVVVAIVVYKEFNHLF